MFWTNPQVLQGVLRGVREFGGFFGLQPACMNSHLSHKTCKWQMRLFGLANCEIQQKIPFFDHIELLHEQHCAALRFGPTHVWSRMAHLEVPASNPNEEDHTQLLMLPHTFLFQQGATASIQPPFITISLCCLDHCWPILISTARGG